MPVPTKYSDVDYRGLPPLLPLRSDFWTVPRCAEGGSVFILGGGASLKGIDLEPLKEQTVIGCNDAYQLGHELVDYCHFTDLKWWQEHQQKLAAYSGTLTTCQRLVPDRAIKLLKGRPAGIEFKNRQMIGVNRNTGLGAINIAVHMGARRIVLLGFDMGGLNAHHWYDRPEGGDRGPTYRMHRRHALEVWEDLQAHGGIRVINASPASTLPFWPQCTPKEALMEITQ